MSLVPFLLNELYNTDDFERPSRLLDQHFGCGLLPEELLEPLTSSPLDWLRPSIYYRPWRTALSNIDTGSTISKDKEKYEISLDVQQFAPEEITVKTADNSIVIEGKHEEKEDEHGYVSRQFVRRYALPYGHDMKDVVSSLSSDGVLTVTAPRKAGNVEEERVVAISQTGPVKAVKDKSQQDAVDK